MEMDDTGLIGVLRGRSRYYYADKEYELSTSCPSIRCYKADSTVRFVKYLNKRAVSGISFTINTQGILIVNTVYTKIKHRRKGYARELYLEAKKQFKAVRHSTNLSEDGKAFSNAVN